jgi:putative Mg2+ transporter-C (MgtC) family protein
VDHMLLTLCSDWSISNIILRLLVSAIAGIVIGIDREIKNKGAGIKTYALVCIGACMAMIVNEYVLREYPASNTDVTRLGAQVISGIGFLGAGTILVTGHDKIRGLTTAAGIWASAGIGLAAGIGFITGAILGLAFIFFIIHILNPFDQYLKRQVRDITVFVIFKDGNAALQMENALHSRGIELKNIQFKREIGSDVGVSAVATLRLPAGPDKSEILLWLRSLSNVAYIQEITFDDPG